MRKYNFINKNKEMLLMYLEKTKKKIIIQKLEKFKSVHKKIKNKKEKY